MGFGRHEVKQFLVEAATLLEIAFRPSEAGRLREIGIIKSPAGKCRAEIRDAAQCVSRTNDLEKSLDGRVIKILFEFKQKIQINLIQVQKSASYVFQAF
jgi:hypothetical protein